MPWNFRIKLKSAIILSLVHFVIYLPAQELWGIMNSNYAGSTGVLLNPSSMALSRLYMDINVLAGDIYFDNNYMYIHGKDYKLINYIKANPEFPKYGPDDMPFDVYHDKIDKYVYESALLKGPSIMISHGRHAFAFHTGARIITSMEQVPYDIANFGYYGLDYAPQNNINYHNKNFGASSLAFGEIGLSYAYAFRLYNMEAWSAGITVKRLFAYSGAYAHITALDYNIINDSTADIKNLKGEAGIAGPLDYNNNDFPVGTSIQGGGFGFDVGITFEHKELTFQKRRIQKICRQRYTDYVYRIGVSLIDIGSVKFSQNAQLHSYDNVSRYWVNIDTISYHNMNTLFNTISDVFYDDPQASYRGNSISVYLPAAFSIQVDYNFKRNLYVAGAFIHPLQISKSAVHRPTQIEIAPRYETRDIEVSIPFSLYEWRYPRIGIALRYKFLTIGTDNFRWIAGFGNFSGLDLYFSVKFNFLKGDCGRLGRYLPCDNEEYGISPSVKRIK